MERAPVKIIRVYGAPRRLSGERRVLVDRLWPRGLRKEDVDFDEWIKDAAPSTELRRWYGHAPGRFDEFAHRYRLELQRNPAAPVVARLRTDARTSQLVLLTATRDVEHSGAEVLRSDLEGEVGL
jgi:uncharacterized protein YeaO (DUF488 family)